jgi:hypothetical protein
MSSYFKNFPEVLYLFGDEQQPVSFQQLTKYVDLVDVLRDTTGSYIEYEIRDGDRPDTLSYRLYGKSEYDWTFFLMNENLREQGWPKTLQQLYAHAQNTMFPNYTAKLSIDEGDSAEVRNLADKYPVGQSVLVQGSNGVVVRKNLNVGEITVSSDSDLTGKTAMTYADGTNLLALGATVYEYQGTHHYENDSGEWIDFFYDVDPFKTTVTNLDFLIRENEAVKKIRVIKKQYIESVVGDFMRLLKRI